MCELCSTTFWHCFSLNVTRFGRLKWRTASTMMLVSGPVRWRISRHSNLKIFMRVMCIQLHSLDYRPGLVFTTICSCWYVLLKKADYTHIHTHTHEVSNSMYIHNTLITLSGAWGCATVFWWTHFFIVVWCCFFSLLKQCFGGLKCIARLCFTFR